MGKKEPTPQPESQDQLNRARFAESVVTAARAGWGPAAPTPPAVSRVTTPPSGHLARIADDLNDISVLGHSNAGKIIVQLTRIADALEGQNTLPVANSRSRRRLRKKGYDL
jgi:hypothetical protein